MAANPFEFDFSKYDLSKYLGDFKVPGVDFEAIIASQRKNIEAVTAANQLAVEGLQAVLRRQAEIVRQSLEEASSLVTDFTAVGAPEEKAVKQTELVKTTFEKALANIKELSELVAKSNSEAAEILAKRVAESLDEVKAAIAKAKV